MENDIKRKCILKSKTIAVLWRLGCKFAPSNQQFYIFLLLHALLVFVVSQNSKSNQTSDIKETNRAWYAYMNANQILRNDEEIEEALHGLLLLHQNI